MLNGGKKNHEQPTKGTNEQWRNMLTILSDQENNYKVHNKRPPTQARKGMQG